ncbi:hypothetical protein FVR03_09485 [Pontibacter qinzhouensis]|uniref:DUF4157 domain-containing protein n=2 Tax=Pontibacter qinzhouensis TaxID=2603253 RepID=A0A5C8K6K7_9BACT|nr:hypothetical protein FVR03_09485 [Pontibacter qinzhouensis]
MDVQVVENSPFARLARMVLKSKNVAMVLGKKVHLSGVSKEVFLKNDGWVAHELCHVEQFRQHGYLRFLWLYLVESMRVGYYNNKYEVEARLAGMKHTQHLAAVQKAASTVKPIELPLPAYKRET